MSIFEKNRPEKSKICISIRCVCILKITMTQWVSILFFPRFKNELFPSFSVTSNWSSQSCSLGRWHSGSHRLIPWDCHHRLLRCHPGWLRCHFWCHGLMSNPWGSLASRYERAARGWERRPRRARLSRPHSKTSYRQTWWNRKRRRYF